MIFYKYIIGIIKGNFFLFALNKEDYLRISQGAVFFLLTLNK